MKFHSFLFIFFLYASSLFSYDSFSILDKNSNVKVIKSPSLFRGNISANEAYLAFTQNKFNPLPLKAKSFGFSDTTHWVGFTLLNQESERLYLYLKNFELEHIKYFIYQDDKLITSSSHTSKLKLHKQNIPTTYLIKIDSKSSLLFAIQIATEAELKLAELPNIVIYSFFLFSFMFLSLYNLILYCWNKEKLIILYSLSSFSTLVLLSLTQEYSTIFIEVNSLLQNIIKLTSLQGTFILFLLFTFRFFDINISSKKLYQSLFVIIIINTLIYAILAFTVSQSILNISFLFLGALFYLFIGVIAFFHKKNFAIVYLLALSGFLIGILIPIMTMGALLEYNELTFSSSLIGAMWTMSILSLVMGYKVKQLQEKNKIAIVQNEAQNKMLFLQSRYASMGETVGNIAHQWKQPLNAIGSIQNSIKAALIFKGEISKEKLLESVETSFKLLEHLGETIDTFYGFLSQKNSNSSSFTIDEELETIRKITEYSFQNSKIKLLFKTHVNPTIIGNANEFTHAILNIVLNAKNALESSKSSNPTIILTLIGGEENCTLRISDNGGGILIKPINSIFDWNASSKENSLGMGLYMTKNIIEKRFGGTIKVENIDDGACFTIVLPYMNQDENFISSEEDKKLNLKQIQKLSEKIIELENIEKTLKKWADIFKHAQWGIAMHAGSGNTIEMVNPMFTSLYGYSSEELKSIDLADLFAPESLDILLEMQEKAFQNGYAMFEAIHRRKDDSLFPVYIELIVIKNKYDEILYQITNIWNITERKAAQKELLLLDIALNNTNEATYMTIDERIIQVNNGACKMLGYSREELTSMTIYDIDNNLLPGTLDEFRKTLKDKKANRFERRHYTKDGHILNVEITTTSFEYDGDIYSFSAVRDITEQKKAREELLLKEFALDTIDEAVYLIDKNSQFYYVNEGACHALGYTKDELLRIGLVDIDIDLSTEFWSKHWENIKNNKSEIVLRYHIRKDGTTFPVEVSANYFEYNGMGYNLAVVRDITERIRLEEQKDNERMRLFFERQIIGMAITSFKEEWVQTNDKLCEMLGYSHEELSKINWVDITHPEDRERDLEQFNKIFSGEIDDYTLEKRVIRKDNEIICINLAVSCVRHEDGSVDYILVLIEDITERKEMEKALVQKEEEYRTLAENNPDGIFRYDHNHRRLYVNPTACKIIGKSAEELIGGTPADGAILVSQQSKIVDEQIDHVFATSESANFMVNFIEQNGELNDYHMLMVPEYDAEGNVASVLGFIRNVTEIRSLEKRQSQYFAMAPGLFATVLKDVDGNYSLPFVSEGIRDIYGVEPEAAMEDISAFVTIAHPEDTEMTFVKAEESARDLSPYHVEYRINHPHKGIRWIECNSMPQRLPDGSVRWDGFYHDITERKELEEALKTSEQKFRTLIENATDNIIRYDKEACITYINPQLENVLDVPSESVLGKTPTQGRTDDIYAPYEIELKKVIATGENTHTYLTLPDTGNGELYHYIQIVAERDVDDNIIGAIAFGRDVTELTTKTIELQKSLEFNEGIIAAIPDLLFEIAPDGTYVGVWAQNPELLVAQREMLLGKNFKEILPPDVVMTSLQTMKEVDEKGFSLGNTYSLDLPEGKRWFELSVSKKKSSGNYITLARDITQRKHIEDELKESETRFRQNSNLLKAVLESSPDIITFALDTNYCYIAFNSKHAQTMHALWGKEIAIGMNMLDVISNDDDRKTAKKSFDRALSGENFINKETYGDRNLSRSYWEIFYAPIISENGEIIGLTCFNIEITERKEMEDAIKALNETLDLQKEKIFYNLFKLSPAAISIISLERNIYLEVNESFLYHTKYTRNEVVEHSIADLELFANPEDKAKFFEIVTRDGEVRNFEYLFKAKDGTTSHATTYASIITLKGEKCLLSHSY